MTAAAVMASILDGWACVRCEVPFTPDIDSIPSGSGQRGQLFRCADQAACLNRMYGEMTDEQRRMVDDYADALRDGRTRFHPWMLVHYRGAHWTIDRCHANGDLTLVGPDDDQDVEPIVVPLIGTLDVHVI